MKLATFSKTKIATIIILGILIAVARIVIIG